MRYRDTAPRYHHTALRYCDTAMRYHNTDRDIAIPQCDIAIPHRDITRPHCDITACDTALRYCDTAMRYHRISTKITHHSCELGGVGGVRVGVPHNSFLRYLSKGEETREREMFCNKHTSPCGFFCLRLCGSPSPLSSPLSRPLPSTSAPNLRIQPPSS